MLHTWSVRANFSQMFANQLPDLLTLVALRRTRSISEAARELEVPRSTVNRRVMRLEADVKVKLIERKRNEVRLTAAGRKLAEGALAASASLETAREEVLAQTRGGGGRMRIAAPPGIAGNFAAAFLLALHVAHPTIIVDMQSLGAPEGARNDDVDLVISFGTPRSSAWVRRRLFRSNLLAVASEAYREQHGAPNNTKDLKQHVLMTMRGVYNLESQWPVWRSSPVSVSPALVTDDLIVLRELALSGAAIVMLPSYVVLPELTDARLVPVLPNLLGRPVDMFASYRSERRSSPLLKAVLETVSGFGAAHQHLLVGTAKPLDFT